jgi:hypothetical protein
MSTLPNSIYIFVYAAIGVAVWRSGLIQGSIDDCIHDSARRHLYNSVYVPMHTIHISAYRSIDIHMKNYEH